MWFFVCAHSLFYEWKIPPSHSRDLLAVLFLRDFRERNLKNMMSHNSYKKELFTFNDDSFRAISLCWGWKGVLCCVLCVDWWLSFWWINFLRVGFAKIPKIELRWWCLKICYSILIAESLVKNVYMKITLIHTMMLSKWIISRCYPKLKAWN